MTTKPVPQRILEEILWGEEKNTYRRHYKEKRNNAKIIIKQRRIKKGKHYKFNRMTDNQCISSSGNSEYK